ncbi:hypothetical protein ACV0BM_016135 [Elizabethkingia meningoseptica]
MSRTRIVKGIYNKITKGSHNMFAEENIVSSAFKEVKQKGGDGISFNAPGRLENTTSDDFKISFSIKKDGHYKTVVPLGILDYEGNYENPFFAFNFSLSQSNVDSLKFEIFDEEGKSIYSMTNLPEVVVRAVKHQNLLENIQKKKPQFDPLKPVNIWDWKTIFIPFQVPSSDYTKIGSYIILWDGFDDNDIYDSTRFNYKNLKAKITATKGNKQKSLEIEFETKYDKVKWVDVKIDKKNKKIDTTLRVNLRDGGAEGLDCSSYITGGRINPHWETKCPWNEISSEALNYYKHPPIKSRTLQYEDLENMALGGINKYWSRTSQNIGKGIKANGELYEFFVNSVQDKKGMVAPRLIYFTNKENTTFNRSHNWEASRELYYKVGYNYYSDWESYNKRSIAFTTKGWVYITPNAAKLRYEDTAAHEIGHQLLYEYGGHIYSKTHKGTSHWSMIYQEPNPGTTYPTGADEIDLMKYADEAEPSDYFNRVILSEKDAASLLWLSKIKIL